MATQTPNLGLKKPAGSDYVLIGDFNDNSDIVDNATGKLSNLQTSEKTNLVAAINEARTTSDAEHAPYIATNGNWFVWDQATSQFVDSGISATGGTGGSVPTGGATGKVLKKASATDYDTVWGDVQALPTGGATGKVLKKASDTDYDTEWGDAQSLPIGGTTGKVLKKASDADYDTEWGDAQSLPIGGTTGKVLKKASDADYDTVWGDVQALPTGGGTGQVLTKSSAADYDAVWATAKLTASLLLYVSATSGNDTTGNGSSAAPFASISKAVSVIPKNINGQIVSITISAGIYNEYVSVSGFFAGIVQLIFAGDVVINGGIAAQISSISLSGNNGDYGRNITIVYDAAYGASQFPIMASYGGRITAGRTLNIVVDGNNVLVSSQACIGAASGSLISFGYSGTSYLTIRNASGARGVSAQSGGTVAIECPIVLGALGIGFFSTSVVQITSHTQMPGTTTSTTVTRMAGGIALMGAGVVI